jgi:hypothetical protein
MLVQCPGCGRPIESDKPRTVCECGISFRSEPCRVIKVECSNCVLQNLIRPNVGSVGCRRCGTRIANPEWPRVAV